MKKLFAWIMDTAEWFFDMQDWKMLLRSIPAVVVALFVVCTVTMNLAANKIVWSGLKIGDTYFVSVTAGLFLSWAVFLIMDMVTKTSGGSFQKRSANRNADYRPTAQGPAALPIEPGLREKVSLAGLVQKGLGANVV